MRGSSLFSFRGSFLVGLDLEKASDLSLEKCLAELWEFLAHLLRGRLHVSSVFAEVGKDPLAENSVGAILLFFGHLIGLSWLIIKLIKRSLSRPHCIRKGYGLWRVAIDSPALFFRLLCVRDTQSCEW